EAESRITDRPIAQGIKKFPHISPAGIVKALQHHSDRRPARMGAKETVLVCPILGEQRGEAVAVICLNRSGEGGQQIAKRQVSHLVVLICRDPFLDSSDYEGANHGIADADVRVRFRTDPCTGLKKTFFAKKWKQRALRLWQCCMARTLIRCSKSIPILRSGIQRKQQREPRSPYGRGQSLDARSRRADRFERHRSHTSARRALLHDGAV